MDKKDLLIGKTYEEAQELLRNEKYRVTFNDEKPFIVTTDFKPERYNLSLQNNIVMNVSFG